MNGEQMIPVAELEVLGLYGPARCTCLEEYTYAGRETVFCIFCEVVESWLKQHQIQGGNNDGKSRTGNETARPEER